MIKTSQGFLCTPPPQKKRKGRRKKSCFDIEREPKIFLLKKRKGDFCTGLLTAELCVLCFFLQAFLLFRMNQNVKNTFLSDT
jgi:hypothetical protein